MFLYSQKINEYITNLLLEQDKWHVDDLEDDLSKRTDKSKIEFDANVINRFVNMNHIDFSPNLYAETTNESMNAIKRKYLQKIILPEFNMRNIPLTDILPLSFEEKRQRLRKILLKEKFQSDMLFTINRADLTREAALILIEQAIPCSLHMNMRITEKFVKMLLQSGINNNLHQKEQ